MMTKKDLLDYIEKTGLVVDFDRKYLMTKSRPYLMNLYMHCKKVKEGQK